MFILSGRQVPLVPLKETSKGPPAPNAFSPAIRSGSLGGLNPMCFPCYSRVLFLMTKSGYQPPRLKEKSKWSAAFHNFVKVTLTKSPKKRPGATKMLSHQLVSQPGLSRGLILDLLDKMRNPGKGLPIAETEDEDPEPPPAIPRRIRSTHQSSSLGIPDADCYRRHMEFRKLRGVEPRPPADSTVRRPPPPRGPPPLGMAYPSLSHRLAYSHPQTSGAAVPGQAPWGGRGGH
uniref:Uncharacterized protein n=1 Tax=Marmota marmota marmota TaxID=9994 RepID=A0A8C6EMC7_MARMA